MRDIMLLQEGAKMKINKKAQMEITGIVFMHIMGLLGIMAFTFLFLSSLGNVSSRAESLNEETLYYNFGRRLISSSDCFAYKNYDVYFDDSSIQSFSRESPGIIDMSKIFDYNHQNCLRYDLVSGSYEQEATAPDVSFPALVYEITVTDLVNDTTFSFKNDFYKSQVVGGIKIEVCDNTACHVDCLPDCNEVYQYQQGTLEIVDSSTLGCPGQDLNSLITIGTNCWYDDLNKAARITDPYSYTDESCDNACEEGCLPNCNELSLFKNDDLLIEDSKSLSCFSEAYLDSIDVEFGVTCNYFVEFDCDIPKSGVDVGQSGNVFQTSLEYSVVLRYPNSGSQDFIEHPGVFHIKFCQIRVPTLCDSFFEGYYYKQAEDGSISFLTDWIDGASEVYQPSVCMSRGLPLI